MTTSHMSPSRRHVTAGLAALLAAGPVRAAAPERWVAYTYQGSVRPGNAARLAAMAEDLTRASRGALAIEFHLGNTLPTRVDDMVAACGRGDVQLADETFFLNTLPGASIVQLPMLIGSQDEYRRAMAIVEPGIVAAYAARGCEVLGRYDFASVHVYGSGGPPIRGLADLRGRRVRTGRTVHNDFLDRFGAKPRLILTPDVAGALERGELDAVVTSFAAGGNVWRDHLTSVLLMHLYQSQAYFIASKTAMARLAPSLRDSIRSLFRAEADNVTHIMRTDEDTVIDWFRHKGVPFTELSAADRREAEAEAAGVWETWADRQGPETTALLRRVRDAVGR